MRKFGIGIHVLTLLLVVFIASCAHKPEETLIPAKIMEPAKERLPVLHDIAGNSVENRPIKSLSIGQGGATILVVAAIHGDECDGSALIWRMAGYFYDHPELLEGLRLILIPEANPDGCFHRYRYNMNSVDLNRNFPSSNHIIDRKSGPKSLTEPETIALAKLVNQYRPVRIVALHQPLGCIDHDGPSEELANHIAKHSDLPLRKLGAKPGSLGSYAGENMKIPTITVELRASAKDAPPDLLWKQYADTLISAVVYPVEAK